MNYNKALNIKKETQKFNEHGEALPYYGNTIISFMNNEKWGVYSLAKNIQSILRKAEFSKKLVFLPLETIHMTVIPLLNESARHTQLWPDDISEEASFREVDQILFEKYKKIPKFEQVHMKITEITPTSIALTPGDEEANIRLKKYRDEIAEITGIKRENHENYQFHISLAYLCRDFSKEDYLEAKETCNKLNQRIQESTRIITVPEPNFTVYNSMLAYSTDLDHRGNLY